MSEPVVITSPNRERALAYLVECLSGSPLVRRLGAVFPECGDVTLITASEPPAGQDFFSGWGGASCSDWLIEEVIRYLKRTPNGLVLFEDPVSSPSDPYLATHEHPPYWCYGDRVYWPVLAAGANYHTAEQAMAWSAGMRVIVAFSRLPREIPLSSGPLVFSDQALQEVASSLTRLVTDVFDWEGYMVWQRRDGCAIGEGGGEAVIFNSRALEGR
jgi:hypothetical protein